MCTKAYSEGRKVKLRKRVLFPGNSCHPLSPENVSGEIDEKDQMVKIINTLDIDEMDTSFLTDETHFEYLQMIKKLRSKGESIEEKF